MNIRTMEQKIREWLLPSWMKFLHVITLALVLITSSNLSAQSHPYLSRFSGEETSGLVYLRWQMIAGNVCNGIDLLRSKDSIQFEYIGHIPGNCGSISEPVNFEFTDAQPIQNSHNYYQLVLGSTGHSQIIKIDVIGLGEDGSKVVPNPIVSEGSIYFRNQNNQEHSLMIFNQYGQLVHENVISKDYFEIPLFLESARYVYLISNTLTGTEFTGDFFVWRKN
jgi:hypothetical protein